MINYDLFYEYYVLKRKSCICCRKHCRAYFRRHMECAVLKRFLKVQGTFSIKKFLQIPLFHLGEGFKTLPSGLRLPPHF